MLAMETRITVVVGGKNYRFSVSKSTTCVDVIKMAKKVAPALRFDVESYAVYESGCGVQKILPERTRVLKHTRSWGANQSDFSLEIREADRLKTKLASLSRAKAKLRKLRSLLMDHELKGASDHFQDNLMSKDVAKDKLYGSKNISALGNTPDLKCSGKRDLMKRYLNDSINYSSDFNFDSVADMNNGFVDADETMVDLNEGMLEENEVTMISGDVMDLNKCVLYEEDGTDTESAFEDDDSLCELERNVIETMVEDSVVTTDKIKAIFGSRGELNSRISEDDLLDSFMNTFIRDAPSDEGVGSTDSEFECYRAIIK